MLPKDAYCAPIVVKAAGFTSPIRITTVAGTAWS